MKKNYYYLLILFFILDTNYIYAQDIVNIPDVNFKSALISDLSININNDSEIQVSEAELHTGTLSLFNKGISDLTGIEAFVNTTKLYCYNNSLTNIDVSKNIALTQLYCYDNLLISIDVSANVSLERLYCYNNSIASIKLAQTSSLMLLFCNNNSLSNIDLLQNFNLTHLVYDDNSFVNLDLSNYTNIREFSCDNNSMLETLNISNSNNMNMTFFSAINNSLLNCIQVDDVTYSNNNWEDIDSHTSFSNNCTLSIDNNTIQDINIHPIPTNSILNIDMREKIKLVIIYSLTGKSVLTTSKKVIDISQLKKGIYLISIEHFNGSFTRKKIVIK